MWFSILKKKKHGQKIFLLLFNSIVYHVDGSLGNFFYHNDLCGAP